MRISENLCTEGMKMKTEFDSFVKSHMDECFDDDGKFDWDEYQYLCDIAEYWEMDE